MDVSVNRNALIARLGRFPEQAPLDPIMGDPINEGEYTRTRVTYMVEPGERIPAWLLVPTASQPDNGWPTILAIHQHAGQFELGKSEIVGLAGNIQYAYGQELCRRGYIVLCPDLLCFEERRPEPDTPWSHLNGYNYERFEFTQRLLYGSCLQTKYLHDLSRSLDLLVSLPNVDATRLGVIGHSLGGQEALWLTWYDPRVTAAVSSCGFSTLEAIVRDGINHNFAAYVPDMLTVCDLDRLVCSLAPRPFLLTAGENDAIFPIDQVHALVECAYQTYQHKGVPERFQAIIFPAGHQLPDHVKTQAYAFLDQWLK